MPVRPKKEVATSTPMAEKRAKKSQTTPQPTKKSPEQVNERVGMEADHVYLPPSNHANFMTGMHLEPREALFKVVKHAETLNAEVTVSEKDGQIQLVVIDQGNGFNVQTALKNLNKLGGLMDIRHRLSLLGCNLHIQSRTHIIMDIPKQQVT